jgi:DNA-binding NarL/FixJ family response regulator
MTTNKRESPMRTQRHTAMAKSESSHAPKLSRLALRPRAGGEDLAGRLGNASQLAAGPRPGEGTSNKKARVYVVDDHALVRRGIAALIGAEDDLELCGEAEDCAVATSEIARLRPEIVVVDISLRGNSGLELIKNIMAMDAKIPVVVLSVHDESVYALRALKAGAKGYVMKHDLATKVIEAIRQVRKGQIYVSERVGSQMFNRLTKGRDALGDSPVSGLSDRELEVVTLIGSGLATREISARLHVSVKTVETHRANIKTKVNLVSGTKLVQFCVRWVEESKRLPDENSSDPMAGFGGKSIPPAEKPAKTRRPA